jgi:hypothetical protein
MWASAGTYSNTTDGPYFREEYQIGFLPVSRPGAAVVAYHRTRCCRANPDPAQPRSNIMNCVPGGFRLRSTTMEGAAAVAYPVHLVNPLIVFHVIFPTRGRDSITAKIPRGIANFAASKPNP